MRRAIRWFVIVVLGPAMLAVPSVAQEKAKPMQEALSRPHAGVKIAVPKGFEEQTPRDRFTVLRATKQSGKNVVLGVTLSAFPQGEKKVTADEIADAMTAEMGKSLAVRNLKLLKKAPMPVADIKGTARLLSYTFRGKQTTAARVFFMRELKSPSVRICYVLTVEAAEGRKPELVRTLGSVIKSIKLIPLQHPREMKVESFQPVWTHYKLDFSIRPPEGWFAIETPAGVAMGQVDYLARPVPAPSPSLSVVAVEMGDEDTCAKIARKTRSHYQTQSARQGLQCKTVSSGQTRLGGVEAQQLVLWIGPKDANAPTTQPANGASYEVVALRIACVPHPGKSQTTRAYTLVYDVTNQPPSKAVASLEAVAGKFKLIGETGESSTTQPVEKGGVAKDPNTPE